MCLALIAFGVHPRYRGRHRRESRRIPRPPRRARGVVGRQALLAGRDLKAGGTWLGVDRRGRFALLTNVREPSRHDPGAPSRGALVPRLLGAAARAVGRAAGARRRRRPPQRLQSGRRRRVGAALGLEPRDVAARARRPASTACRTTCSTRRGRRSSAPRPRSRAGARAAATRRSRAAVRAAARHRARARRRAPGDRRPARVGAAAVGAVHRQPDLRHALLDGRHHRPRRRRALRRAQLRSGGQRRPAKSTTGSRVVGPADALSGGGDRSR